MSNKPNEEPEKPTDAADQAMPMEESGNEENDEEFLQGEEDSNLPAVTHADLAQNPEPVDEDDRMSTSATVGSSDGGRHERPFASQDLPVLLERMGLGGVSPENERERRDREDDELIRRTIERLDSTDKGNRKPKKNNACGGVGRQEKQLYHFGAAENVSFEFLTAEENRLHLDEIAERCAAILRELDFESEKMKEDGKNHDSKKREDDDKKD